MVISPGSLWYIKNLLNYLLTRCFYYDKIFIHKENSRKGIVMTHSKIVSIAKGMGISNASKLKSVDLIRTIQTKEGNYACFGSGKAECDQQQCCWRENCIK